MTVVTFFHFPQGLTGANILGCWHLHTFKCFSLTLTSIPFPEILFRMTVLTMLTSRQTYTCLSLPYSLSLYPPAPPSVSAALWGKRFEWCLYYFRNTSLLLYLSRTLRGKKWESGKRIKQIRFWFICTCACCSFVGRLMAMLLGAW